MNLPASSALCVTAIATSQSAPNLDYGTKYTKVEYSAFRGDGEGPEPPKRDAVGRLIKSPSKKSVLFEAPAPADDKEGAPPTKHDLNRPISRASTQKRSTRPTTPASRLSHGPSQPYRLPAASSLFSLPNPHSPAPARNSLDSQLASLHSQSPSPTQLSKHDGGGFYEGGKGLSMSHSLTSLHRRPLRILCLDGGGVRGLSSLLILKKIMERIEDSDSPFTGEKGWQGLSSVDEMDTGSEAEKMKDTRKRQPSKPCEYFDLICGTSTGGLIALMLGRLRMTVDECIKAYLKLSSKVFSSPRALFGLPYSASRFSGSVLENAIKDVVRSSQTVSRDSVRDLSDPAEDIGNLVLKDETEGACKTFVLAAYSGSAGGTVKLFRSYDTAKDRADECAIWQAGRATSAAPTFFSSVTCATQMGGPEITYVDAGLGHNNPTEAAIIECEDAFPGRSIGLVLSVGTGRQPDTRLNAGCFSFMPVATQLSVAMACFHISTGVDQVDQRVARHPIFTQGGGKYVRLNVDRAMEGISLEEWAEAGQIATATDIYLHSFSTGLLLTEAVNTLRRLTYRNHDVYIPATEAVGCNPAVPGVPFEIGKAIWIQENEADISGVEEDWYDTESQAKGTQAVKQGLTCQRIGEFDLRIICKVPHGRYSVSYLMAQQSHEAHSDGAANGTVIELVDGPLPDLTITAGRPFDARSFATRPVSRLAYKDIAAQLIRPPFDRTLIGASEWSRMEGQGWMEVRAGCEVNVELDGYVAFVVETCSGVKTSARRFSIGAIRMQHIDW